MSGMQPLTPLAAGSVALAVTGTTGRVALPGISASTSQGVRQLRQYVITNAGPDTAYIRFGSSTVEAVVATGYPVLPGSQQTFSATDTHVAGISSTTAALVISAGDGQGPSLGAASGGSSGGGGFPIQVAAASITSVNSDSVTAQLLAANASRRGLIVVNTDANALYLKYGTTATTAGGGYTAIIPANGYWEMPLPIYTGRIDGIWAANGAGLAELTEL